jgi:hypothetical protein
MGDLFFGIGQGDLRWVSPGGSVKRNRHRRWSESRLRMLAKSIVGPLNSVMLPCEFAPVVLRFPGA